MFGSFLGIPSSTAVAQLSVCSLHMRSTPAMPGFCRERVPVVEEMRYIGNSLHVQYNARVTPLSCSSAFAPCELVT